MERKTLDEVIGQLERRWKRIEARRMRELRKHLPPWVKLSRAGRKKLEAVAKRALGEFEGSSAHSALELHYRLSPDWSHVLWCIALERIAAAQKRPENQMGWRRRIIPLQSGSGLFGSNGRDGQ